VVLILINAFLAASEIAIVSVRKTRVKQLAEEQEHPAAKAVLRLTENPSRFLATVQVGVTVAGLFASAVGAISAVALLSSALRQVPVGFVAGQSDAISFIVVTLTIAFFTLVFGELVPKSLAIQSADRIALAVARPIELLSRLLGPVVAVLTFSTNIVLALFGSGERARLPSVTESEIRSIVDAAAEEGVVEPSERDMIEGIFDFGDLRVREVMVPRVDIVALEKDTPLNEVVQLFLERGYSRMPVYEDNIDNVIGILHAKDLIRYLGNGEKALTLGDLMRPAIFVPETKKVDELLREFRQSRNHMAIVVDEYGGTAGLVTLENLVEEIVGDIQDEYGEPERKEIEMVGEDEAIVNARVTLDEVNQALTLDLQEEGVDTIGGLVYTRLGRMPVVDDRVELPEATITVLSVTGRRIDWLRIRKHEPPRQEDREAAA